MVSNCMFIIHLTLGGSQTKAVVVVPIWSQVRNTSPCLVHAAAGTENPINIF